MGKSKRSQSPAITRRKRSKKTAKQDFHMDIHITKQQETTILQTIKTLYSREYEKNVDRDAEFVKFLHQLYRSCQSQLRPIYQGAPQSLLKSCADEARNFQGVNKRATEDDDANLLKSIRFDLDEGKSWADQRRAKWIVPLCVGWLDAVEQEVNQLRSELDLSERFLVDSVVKLLTTAYHPPARQSTTTNLICTQTMNNKLFRQRLTELTGIELPRPKELISKWLADVRENGFEPRSSPHTVFSTSTSVGVEQDDPVRRDLEMRNSTLELQVTTLEEMLRKCQNALAACQRQRDALQNQLERIHSNDRPPLMTSGWPYHGTGGLGGFDGGALQPMPPAIPAPTWNPPPCSYDYHFDSSTFNSTQEFGMPSSADTSHLWPPGNQGFYQY